MPTEGIAPRGGCRFIQGDPREIHERGEAIYCRKPVARKGGVWCREHERLVYVSMKEILEARKAA